MCWTIRGHISIVNVHCCRVPHKAEKKEVQVEKTMFWNELLKDERTQRGWSQRDVADRIGGSTKTISRWERGMSFPGPYNRQKLAKIFEKSVEELGLVEQNARESAHENQPASRGTPQEDWGEAPGVEH